jgi:hypothetical protein
VQDTLFQASLRIKTDKSIFQPIALGVVRFDGFAQVFYRHTTETNWRHQWFNSFSYHRQHVKFNDHAALSSNRKQNSLGLLFVSQISRSSKLRITVMGAKFESIIIKRSKHCCTPEGIVGTENKMQTLFCILSSTWPLGQTKKKCPVSAYVVTDIM